MPQRKAVYDIWYDTPDGERHFVQRKAGGRVEVQQFARTQHKNAYVNFVEYV